MRKNFNEKFFRTLDSQNNLSGSGSLQMGNLEECLVALELEDLT
jgi:hypothetical protein